MGNIEEGLMHLSETGKIALEYWRAIPIYYPNTQLDAFVVMPNHIHGIIRILETPNPITNMHDSVGATDPVAPDPVAPESKASTSPPPPPNGNINPKGPKPNSIGPMIGQFKSEVTKKINRMGKPPFWAGWQINYNDRIIRNQDHN